MFNYYYLSPIIVITFRYFIHQIQKLMAQRQQYGLKGFLSFVHDILKSTLIYKNKSAFLQITSEIIL